MQMASRDTIRVRKRSTVAMLHRCDSLDFDRDAELIELESFTCWEASLRASGDDDDHCEFRRPVKRLRKEPVFSERMRVGEED